MKYLGLILHGPLQSWGSPSLANVNSQSPRNTEFVPTKSALIGFLRSALGVSRGEDDGLNLSDLRVIVRADRPGSLGKDYQIAQRIHHGFRAGGTKEIPKFYLQDSTFVVLLGHEDERVIQRLSEALNSPHWSPYLGRRAHVPSLPPYLGVIDTEDPRQFLGEEVPMFWGAERLTTKRVTTYDSSVDAPYSDRIVEELVDEPLSLHVRDNRYASRRVQVYNWNYSRSEGTPQQTIRQYEKMLSVFER